jgi:CRISPR/Cas system-associated exonuclease Cas4 (RecB family)
MGDVDQRYYDGLAWSYSRHVAFNECRRAYWFEYVAVHHASIDLALKTRLWELKRLRSKRFLLGQLVHDSISEFISQRAKGREMAEADIQQHLAQNLERHRREARKAIAEYYNGLPVEDEFFDRLRTQGTEALSMFLRVLWPPLSRLEYSQHEQSERFLMDGIPVAVKVDLVSKSLDGRIFIIDWKTGPEGERYQDNLQVGAYSLWGAFKFGVDPAKVATDLSYLRTGKTVSKSLTPEQLAVAKETIAKEYREFSGVVDRANNPPNPSPERCLGCKFATVCDAADLSRLLP